MTYCRLVIVPGNPTTVELPEEKELDPEDIHRAQRMAGSLIWLSTRTRPDITYAQSRISSMMTKAPKTALMEGMRILRCLSGTKHVGLSFKPCPNFIFIFYGLLSVFLPQVLSNSTQVLSHAQVIVK